MKKKETFGSMQGRRAVGGGGKNPRTASFLEWSTNRPQGKCSD